MGDAPMCEMAVIAMRSDKEKRSTRCADLPKTSLRETLPTEKSGFAMRLPGKGEPRLCQWVLFDFLLPTWPNAALSNETHSSTLDSVNDRMPQRFKGSKSMLPTMPLLA
jgi:hypothetical protein